MTVTQFYLEVHVAISNVTCYSPPDPSLTCQSVSAALQTVEDGYDIDGTIIYGDSLEGILNIPFSKKREIREESTGAHQYREKIVHYYIKTNPNASWDGTGRETSLLREGTPKHSKM